MVVTRTLAYENADAAKIAAIMDEAEYLPTLLLHSDDVDREFLEHLEHIAAKWSEFRYVVIEYEAASEESPQRELAGVA